MQPPCKLSPAGIDSDADLQLDVENAECVRMLRLNIYRWQDWYKVAEK
nr:MAG TPA: hypothetical protein [Caudoviricetes sp.]